MTDSTAEHYDIHIALVDDDEDDRFIIKNLLKKLPQKIHLTEYKNGKECLDAFVQNLQKNNQLIAEFIILDLNMPVMTGQEFLIQFKRFDSFQDIPVVVLTTSEDEEILKDAFDLGAFNILRKADGAETRQKLTQMIIDYWTSELH